MLISHDYLNGGISIRRELFHPQSGSLLFLQGSFMPGLLEEQKGPGLEFQHPTLCVTLGKALNLSELQFP